MRAGNHLNRCDEAIPLARNRLDKRGNVGRISQRLPDFVDCGVDTGLDINEYVLAPQSVDDVATQDELMSILDQMDEEVHRPALQFHGAPVTSQLVDGHVELEVTKSEGLARI